MAKQLIESMTSEWQPDGYQDEFRERLSDIIKKRVKQAGATTTFEEPEHREDSATNVVDFMALLQKSLKPTSAPRQRQPGEARLKPSAKDSKSEEGRCKGPRQKSDERRLPSRRLERAPDQTRRIS